MINQDLMQKAESGDTDAMRSVAMEYMKRFDGENDNFVIALDWMDRAAEHGNLEAMSDMADVYRKHNKPEKAFEYEERAAKAGRAKSMYNLSIHYRDGLGVPVNKEKHMYWYNKGKENGFPPG